GRSTALLRERGRASPDRRSYGSGRQRGCRPAALPARAGDVRRGRGSQLVPESGDRLPGRGGVIRAGDAAAAAQLLPEEARREQGAASSAAARLQAPRPGKGAGWATT